jgi:hypothetical protein
VEARPLDASLWYALVSAAVTTLRRLPTMPRLIKSPSPPVAAWPGPVSEPGELVQLPRLLLEGHLAQQGVHAGVYPR